MFSSRTPVCRNRVSRVRLSRVMAARVVVAVLAAAAAFAPQVSAQTSAAATYRDALKIYRAGLTPEAIAMVERMPPEAVAEEIRILIEKERDAFRRGLAQPRMEHRV